MGFMLLRFADPGSGIPFRLGFKYLNPCFGIRLNPPGHDTTRLPTAGESVGGLVVLISSADVTNVSPP